MQLSFMKKYKEVQNLPASTYRVQLHKGFTLKDLEQQIDYLDRLGITAIYASPIFQATPGSMHGYDVTSPHRVNPEIGDLSDLKWVSSQLKQRKMLWIQDIVPNHMAFNQHNTRLMDVLERGTYSDYHTYFDIDWDHPTPDLNGRLMVPFLGKELKECLQSREIKLTLAPAGLQVQYFDQAYPLAVSAYSYLRNSASDDAQLLALDLLTSQARSLKGLPDWVRQKSEWAQQINSNRQAVYLLTNLLEGINKDPEKLAELLDLQPYVLTYWKRTTSEINYRRFFTINGLICLRMEDKGVFEEYHSFLHELYEQDLIDGLRIDHIDGLNDPDAYLQMLRSMFGERCYIIAEKILGSNEPFPEHWSIQGESGYQFLGYVNQVLTSKQGASELSDFYHTLIPDTPEYQQMVYESKKHILLEHMGGEWDNLTRYFFDLGLYGDFEQEKIKSAIGVFMLCLPVYRIYPFRLPLIDSYRTILQESLSMATELSPEHLEALNYLNRLFTAESDVDNHQITLFLNRLMQFTGPLTAKGVEDTVFYRYNSLISHSEVGDSPSTRGISAQEYHNLMQQRLKETPLSLNATATHDTKRGEDARMRLNVLSEFPAEWEQQVITWMKLNKAIIATSQAPSLNDEYYIYQALLGGFPEGLKVTEEFIGRFQEYLLKVVREAKTHSNWESPDEDYESGCKAFIEAILDSGHSFLPQFVPFAQKTMEYARVYSLAQVLLKLTSPGIPDIYQGCELWDLSFVDPDNRRPVDYRHRAQFLKQLEQMEWSQLLPYLETNKQAGIQKLFIIWKLLKFRREDPLLFTSGIYQPLLATRKRKVLAYFRRYEGRCMLIIVPTVPYLRDASLEILIPKDVSGEWENLLTGTTFHDEGGVTVNELFRDFPVAALVRK